MLHVGEEIVLLKGTRVGMSTLRHATRAHVETIQHRDDGTPIYQVVWTDSKGKSRSTWIDDSEKADTANRAGQIQKWPQVLPPIDTRSIEGHKRALSRGENVSWNADHYGARIYSIMIDDEGSWRWADGAWQPLSASKSTRRDHVMRLLGLREGDKAYVILSRRYDERSVNMVGGTNTVTVIRHGKNFKSTFSQLPGKTFGPFPLGEMVRDLTVSALLSSRDARDLVLEASAKGRATVPVGF